jgi:hypothetical protein
MNALIYRADINTHMKIVALALVAAIFIALIGIQAHIGA